MTLVDLSHPITPGMVTTTGLPGPEVLDHLTFEASRPHYAEGTEFCIRELRMVSATGTYLDAPAHRWRDGVDVAGLPLERCAGLRVVVVDVEGLGVAGPETVPDDVADAAVLFRTGWSRHWGTARYRDPEHPHLSAACAEALVAGGAALVGIDAVNVDDQVGRARPVHGTLLAAGIPVVENLTNLAALTGGEELYAVPLAVVGMPSIPVRALAVRR